MKYVVQKQFGWVSSFTIYLFIDAAEQHRAQNFELVVSYRNY